MTEIELNRQIEASEQQRAELAPAAAETTDGTCVQTHDERAEIQASYIRIVTQWLSYRMLGYARLVICRMDNVDAHRKIHKVS